MDDQIVKFAEYTLREWKGIIDASNGDCWYLHEKRRAYQDVLQAMKGFGLIADYNVETCKVTLDGRQDRSNLVFVRTGKRVTID